MVFIRQRSMLSGMLVQEAMRKRVIRVSPETSLSDCINRMIKHKISAVLVAEEDGRSVGVVSKTDLIGSFYANLPVEMPAVDIMAAPPLLCYPDDSLESAIDLMHAQGVHRLYVSGAETNRVIGKLVYPDVVGLLYRYCRACGKSVSRSGRSAEDETNRLAAFRLPRRPRPYRRRSVAFRFGPLSFGLLSCLHLRPPDRRRLGLARRDCCTL